MNPVELELCAASLEALQLAKTYAFTRIELCQNLEQGGLTPSAGLIETALALGLPTHVLIRPRAGGFHYNAAEMELIKRDIAYCAHMGVHLGVGGKVVNNQCIQCPFHGWVYDGETGACVGKPFITIQIIVASPSR